MPITVNDAVEVYDPNEVVIEADGDRLCGWVRVELGLNEPINRQSQPSADGKIFWVRVNNRWGTCTIELTQDSPAHGQLKKLVKRKDPWGFSFKDMSGTEETGTMSNCMLMETGQIVRSAGEENIRYTIGGTFSIDGGGIS